MFNLSPRTTARRARVPAAAALAVAALLVGCSQPSVAPTAQTSPSSAAADRPLTDRNPQPREALREGGDLRIPIDALPGNFNPLQIDGARSVTYQFADAILPTAFKDQPDGGSTPHPAYFTAIEVISDSPQVVRYRINPKATWSNGRTLDWRDLRDQWRALNGTDARYQVSNTVGYANVAKVERGADDQEALLTYRSPFADWKALFRPLAPHELTSTPEHFNTAWKDGPLITSGPFEVERVDLTAKTFTVKRSARWWQQQPKLDRVVFRTLDSAARADELANGGLDWTPVNADVDLFKRTSAMTGVQIRAASERLAGQLTFNGADGALLSDPALRRAISQAINPQQVTDVVVGPITPGARAVGHHVVPPSHADYRDNSAELPYDPAAAGKTLDEQGWTRTGTDLRRKGGTELTLRMVAQQTPAGETTASLIAEQLKQVGVGTRVQIVPIDRFASDYLRAGQFDLITFEWTKSPYPVSHDRSVFQTPKGDVIGNNFGRVAVPQIEKLYDRAVAELDPAKASDLVQQIDREAWRSAHHLPLYPGTGAYAVHTDLANFGARGLGAWDFAEAGFVK
ncbi:MAG: ABC transporter family substrate-binding protein [Micropruina sp.]|uniref:ABC transporter family substrate-binding protein n=1 Tax=Micropruina sp. TaxID=2737536 RepID=UPI0039E6DF0D